MRRRSATVSSGPAADGNGCALMNKKSLADAPDSGRLAMKRPHSTHAGNRIHFNNISPLRQFFPDRARGEGQPAPSIPALPPAPRHEAGVEEARLPVAQPIALQ